MLNYVNTGLILFVCSRIETLIVPGDFEAKHKCCPVASPYLKMWNSSPAVSAPSCRVRGLANELPAHPGQHYGSRSKSAVDGAAQRHTGGGSGKRAVCFLM